MNHPVIFLAATALSFGGALWVYLGVRRREAARIGVVVGALPLFSSLAVHFLATTLGWQTNSRIIATIGLGTGILLVGVGGMIFGARSTRDKAGT